MLAKTKQKQKQAYEVNERKNDVFEGYDLTMTLCGTKAKWIVLICDGDDNMSTRTADEVKHALEQVHALESQNTRSILDQQYLLVMYVAPEIKVKVYY